METKSTFNENQVRKSFKTKLCGEFILPSGKPSGYYKFPITNEEINELSQDLDPAEKPRQFLTWSEWALFTSLRRKYGIKYLYQRTKQGWWLLRDDVSILPEKEEYNLEEKLQFYVDSRLLEVIANQEPAQDTEKNEKNFRSSLDNSNLDVLY